MAGRVEALRQKLERLLKETAEAAVALDWAEGRIQGVPHYSVIEAGAHQVGRQLSRRIQARQMSELAAQESSHGKCPACGTRCELTGRQRRVTSVDGKLPIQELVGHCPCCRRSFFPAAGGLGS